MNPPDGLDPRRHQPFRFRTVAALRAAADSLGLDLPVAEDCGLLLRPLTVGRHTAPNRIAVQPMEGCDALSDGSPSDWTTERYRRFADGGSGVIWFEATSVTQDGRANPRQLVLSATTMPAFRRLVRSAREAARVASGSGHHPVLVLQLTHSGRYSRVRPGWIRRVACRNPYLDNAGEPLSIWRDEELDELADRFIAAAVLAREAGFDAVDIKACHGYLVHELLAAHTRDDSRYGGPLANRSRFLLSVIGGVRRAAAGIDIAVRLSAADGVPYPYGFGTTPSGARSAGVSEPAELAARLAREACAVINVTAGIPARTPHLGRPFNRNACGAPPPAEHPLVGVARLIGLAAEIQRAAGVVPVVGTGYSWLQQFWPRVGAGVLQRGWAACIGVGRGAIAYPDAPRDLARTGSLEPRKCCVACSYCTDLMRADVPTGCVVRDRQRYRPPAAPKRLEVAR